jgi:glycine dehydrogenase subunit 1
MGSYIPTTGEERQEMLSSLGVKSASELFSDVPRQVFLQTSLNLPEGKTELEVRREMTELSRKNKTYSVILRGAGAYNHYIPSIVKYITSKEEFVTAYTPYQAEISQGILQSIFEYQTMICELTGLDVSNASMYDGAEAAAEAVAMCRERKRVTALVLATTHPDTIATIQTYCNAANAQMRIVPEKDGVTDINALESMLGEDTACLFVQQPNFYGALEDAKLLGEKVHTAGGKYILGVNPIALAVMQSPGEAGADIAVGEGQPLGMPLSFGGPYLGFMAATTAMMRKLPGRIVGETTDHNGNRAFVLTLQAREQHIRREKASSNVCSNQALCALTAAVYLSAMGPEGLKEAAIQSMSKAHYLMAGLAKIPGIRRVGNAPFFHEFVTACGGKRDVVLKALEQKDILGGLPIGDDQLLWCATEQVSREQLDTAIQTIREVCGK